MEGKFLNPKYERRRKRRRRVTISTVIISLVILGGSGIYNVDLLIRSTMLPSAPPMASMTETQDNQYKISFFGNEFTIDISPMIAVADAVVQLKNTPPAHIRLFHQIKALVTLEIPPNHGGSLEKEHV